MHICLSYHFIVSTHAEAARRQVIEKKKKSKYFYGIVRTANVSEIRVEVLKNDMRDSTHLVETIVTTTRRELTRY